MKLLLIHKPKVCVHCGRAFTQRRKTCSKRCAAAYARSVRLTEKAARRARVAVGSEIDPIAVFIRDGWQCQACGCDTPRSLRGTYEDDAPEIDHTIPLAMDGEHSMDNVQCLCRCCNILKGTSTMQEFVKNYIGNNNLAGRVGQSGPHSGGNRCWPF